MAGLIIGSTTAKGTTSLDEKFKNPAYVREKLANRIVRAETKIRKILPQIIEDAVRRNRIIRFLTNPPVGVVGYDLRAEFGLREQQVEDAIAVIIYTLKSSFDFEIRGKFASTKLSTLFTPYTKILDPKMYEDRISKTVAYSAQKMYKNKAAAIRGFKRQNPNQQFLDKVQDIRWGKWLMNARRGYQSMLEDVPDIGEFGIAYNLNANQRFFSRSGRALMLRGNRQRNLKRVERFPYDFPVGAKPLAGDKNFVESIAHSQRFYNDVTQSIIKTINSVMFPRKR